MESLRSLKKQLVDANQRCRDLANENFELRAQVANLRLVSPQGERLSSLLPVDARAFRELEWAIYQYVIACGGKPQVPHARRPRGKKRR